MEQSICTFLKYKIHSLRFFDRSASPKLLISATAHCTYLEPDVVSHTSCSLHASIRAVLALVLLVPVSFVNAGARIRTSVLFSYCTACFLFVAILSFAFLSFAFLFFYFYFALICFCYCVSCFSFPLFFFSVWCHHLILFR